MISLIKHNKLFSFMIFSSALIFIIGIICSSILDNDAKKMIHDNISNIILNIQNKTTSNFNCFIKCFSNNIFIYIFIWLLGISIIGVFLVLFLYCKRN